MNYALYKTKKSDANGYASKFIICKSIFHWSKNCSDRNKEEVPGEKTGKEKVIMFNKEIRLLHQKCFDATAVASKHFWAKHSTKLSWILNVLRWFMGIYGFNITELNKTNDLILK